MSINKVLATGNLTHEPELKATQNQTQFLTFGVAVNDRRKNPQTDQWENVPNFIDCVVFGAKAESLSKYLRKGMKVAIEGKLHYSSWERDGRRNSKLEVYVDNLEFMSAKQSTIGQQPNIPTTQQQAAEYEDEDIPF